MFLAGLQILADGHDVYIGIAQIAHRLDDFFLGFPSPA
jgi:hypothetical protein